ncbi:MAG: tol-pal system-associated acyl-CoA thioesterase [Alphaproteobacteria bacterium]
MAEPVPCGRIDDGTHVLALRVYYEDTDAAGIVYYANYLKFAERGRTEMMRLLGAEHRSMAEGEGLAWAVRRCAIDYLRPARLDDLLEVRTRLVDVGAARLDAEQVVRRAAVDLARLDLRLACIDRRGRPARLPAAMRSALLAIIPPQSRA